MSHCQSRFLDSSSAPLLLSSLLRSPTLWLFPWLRDLNDSCNHFSRVLPQGYRRFLRDRRLFLDPDEASDSELEKVRDVPSAEYQRLPANGLLSEIWNSSGWRLSNTR